MIYCFETVPSSMEKDIYIWGVERYSILVFTFLAFREIDIKGFVTDKKQYVGQQFMNRPIISVQEAKVNNVLVIVPDDCRNFRFKDGLKMTYFKDSLVINEKLMGKKLIIYGAGKQGEICFEKLESVGGNVEAFCTTNKEKDTYLGKKVILIDEVPLKDEYAVIIATEREDYKIEMLKMLMKKNIPNIFLNELMEYWDVLLNTFFQSIHNAASEKRQIYIYTNGEDAILKLLCSVLERYGIAIAGYVSKEEKENITSVYDLAYQDVSKLFVIVNETDIVEMQKTLEILEGIGLCIQRLDYAGLRIVVGENINPRRLGVDFLLEYSVCDGRIPGVEIYGDENEKSIRIVILGGSTSTDRAYRQRSWPSFLYTKLKNKGVNVTIYNCAHCAHDVTRELLRFIRDGWYLKPDYVISMSGLNNLLRNIRESNNQFNLEHVISMGKFMHPDSEYVYGIEEEEDTFDFWVRMEKVLNAVVSVYGGKLLTFLQPMKIGKPNHSLLEEVLHEYEGYGEYENNFRKKAKDDDFYINLLSLFDKESEMFIDSVHYSAKGNNMLADVVLDTLLKEIEPD